MIIDLLILSCCMQRLNKTSVLIDSDHLFTSRHVNKACNHVIYLKS